MSRRLLSVCLILSLLLVQYAKVPHTHGNDPDDHGGRPHFHLGTTHHYASGVHALSSSTTTAWSSPGEFPHDHDADACYVGDTLLDRGERMLIGTPQLPTDVDMFAPRFPEFAVVNGISLLFKRANAQARLIDCPRYLRFCTFIL